MIARKILSKIGAPNLPFFLLFLGLIIGLWFIPNARLMVAGDGGIRPFFIGLASLSGILMGFTISSLSILAAFRDHKLVNNLKKTGHYSELLKNFYWTGVAFFFSMILALACFFWQQPYFWKVGITSFLISLYFLSVAAQRFRLVLNQISKPEGDPNILD